MCLSIILLQNFIVSSDFDKKEQMSRNFIRLIGPYTEPVLIHQWAAGEHSFTVTFLWLNPYDELINVTSTNIEESALVSSFYNCFMYNLIYLKL